LTVADKSCAEQVIDKSRFIALVSRVNDNDAVNRHLQEAGERYPNARHYVYAWRLHEGKAEKASDDGEPQGTGGRPVLDLLQHHQIWDALIIVVRYFGGVLLGTGGLTRAYAGTARLALDRADIVELVQHIQYSLESTYSWYEQVKYGLRQKGWEIGEESFAESVSLTVFIPEKEHSFFEKWIDELTNKSVTWTKVKQTVRQRKI